MIQLLPDFKEFLQSLNDYNVRYLLIGGYAVSHYGYVRPTGDIDVWVANDAINAKNIYQAMTAFGFSGIDETTFTHPSQLVQMGIPPVRIELATFIDGVEFEACYLKRQIETLDGVSVSIISLEDLRVNKQASGRFKDLADLEHLPVSIPDEKENS
ncbi:MAG: nucleotidyltransferase [Deinococcota bacterium]